MKTVPLYGKKAAGRVAKVSDSKYDLVMAHRWYVWQPKHPTRNFGPYPVTNIQRPDGSWTKIRMHNLIMGSLGIDHRNGDGLDCQDHNLRKASDAENAQNRGKRAGTTSRFKGVYWDARKRRWRAQIKSSGTNRNLGRFADEEAAARAYDTAALEEFGEFARPNFPSPA